VKWDAALTPGYENTVTFYHFDGSSEPMDAWVERVSSIPLLRVRLTRAHRSGRWRAALLDATRVQLGIIEIEL
jgi:hypothetical protein